MAHDIAPRTLGLLLSLCWIAPCLGAATMVDPVIDDETREWCYLAKSTTVIGVPYMPDAVQVTFDGAIYTRNAELCFFYGDPLRPVMARQKTYLDGWIPVVQYQWTDGPIAYGIEMFGAVLDGFDETNTVQFIRLTARNTSDRTSPAQFAAALRANGGDHRFGKSPFDPTWRYTMADNGVLRNGRLVYAFSEGARREAVPGVAYTRPFLGHEYHVTPRAEVGVVRYRRDLGPGQTFAAAFKMPRVPVPSSETAFLKALGEATYDGAHRSTVDGWRALFAAGSQFDIPEKRVNDAVRGSLVQLMLATRQRGGQRFQTSGLLYPNFFMIDYIDMRMAYDAMGQPAFARQSFEQVFRRQHKDGLFCDTSLSHGKRLWSSHGHMVHSLAHHCLMTRDWDYARQIYPRLRHAVEWIRTARAADEHGLMPPAWPYDAEMIKGRYTSHNLWCLLGLRSSVRLARQLGEAKDAAAWQALHDDYQAAVLKAIQATAGDDGYVPTGLYAFVTGPASRPGFAEYRTNQDWENLLLAYPTEVLGPQDGHVTATLDLMHRIRYREGIMTYRNGMHLHQYLTTNVTHQHLVRGEQRQALTDLYHILLHCGSTHEGYENMVLPWQTRDTSRWPPPHAWAAAKITLLIRNMLVLEQGGRAGLDEGQRDLLLFGAVAPTWAKAGQHIAIRNARTEMGTVNARMAFGPAGAAVTLSNAFHTPPRHLLFRVPYFVELAGYTTDATESKRAGDVIRLSPDATRLAMTWTPRPDAHQGAFANLLLTYRREVGHWPGRIDQHPEPPPGFLTDAEKARGPEPLSFALVVEAFRHEFARRFREHVKAGGPVVGVEAPPLLTAEERRAAFVKQYGDMQPRKADPKRDGIAVGKPASASAVHQSYTPAKAVDGVVALESSWQADPYPQWLRIDLEKPTRIDRIHVYPYWGAGRRYRYTVEVSADGKSWRQAIDMSANTQPATPKGDDHRMAPTTARYVRVTLLHHSLNTGVHLVEVKVFAAD